MRTTCSQPDCENRIVTSSTDVTVAYSFAQERGWLWNDAGVYCPNHLWVRKALSITPNPAR